MLVKNYSLRIRVKFLFFILHNKCLCISIVSPHLEFIYCSVISHTMEKLNHTSISISRKLSKIHDTRTKMHLQNISIWRIYNIYIYIYIYIYIWWTTWLKREIKRAPRWQRERGEGSSSGMRPARFQVEITGRITAVSFRYVTWTRSNFPGRRRWKEEVRGGGRHHFRCASV